MGDRKPRRKGDGDPGDKGMGTQEIRGQEPRRKGDRNPGEKGTGTQEKRGREPRRKGYIWLPQVRKWSGEKNPSRSGKCRGILFWVRENWHFEEKSGKIEILRLEVWRLEAATISEI